MTKSEFKKQARKHGIPDYMYNLNGPGRNDERFCLEFDGAKWNVYYAEWGVKTTNKYFDSESDALEFILDTLKD